MNKTKRGLKNKEIAQKKWEPLKEQIAWLYTQQNWSQKDIAKHFYVSQTTVGKAMRRLGINSNGKGRKGVLNGRYKDGSQSTLYRQMIEKDFCSNCRGTKKLVIHHKNGNHQDNHLENLQVLCESCHNRLTMTLYWSSKKTVRNEIAVRRLAQEVLPL